jgi:hypothetical protein
MLSSYVQILCMNFHILFLQQYHSIITIVEDCPVCNETKNIQILQCGHSVCKDCIVPTCILCSQNNIMERV